MYVVVKVRITELAISLVILIILDSNGYYCSLTDFQSKGQVKFSKILLFEKRTQPTRLRNRSIFDRVAFEVLLCKHKTLSETTNSGIIR